MKRGIKRGIIAVLGGAGAMGRAAVYDLARSGERVLLLEADLAAARQVARRYGGRATLAEQADARDPAALAALHRALETDRTGEVTLAMRELLREAEAPQPGELAARHDLLVAALLRRAPARRCARCGAAAAVRSFRCARCGAFDPFA
jgi:NAD(P)-dependent dehydrogenase (short-subunit alcohol dehydrogenase family)